MTRVNKVMDGMLNLSFLSSVHIDA
jgi:hypothetical protein